jgi:hypothetical protein
LEPHPLFREFVTASYKSRRGRGIAELASVAEASV